MLKYITSICPLQWDNYIRMKIEWKDVPIFESLIRVKHRCPFIDLTTKYPSLRIYFWCNRVHELLEVIVDKQEEYSAVLSELAKIARIVDESSDKHNVRFIVSDCLCTRDNSVEMIMEDLNIVHISPMVNEAGWEYYSMMAFKQEDVSSLISRLEKKNYTVEIVRKAPFEGALSSSLLSSDAIFSDLTEKQAEAVFKAYSHGYYRFPRIADVQEIASRERIPRTTFQEHLKRGENKLINSLIPYMRLYRRNSATHKAEIQI